MFNIFINVISQKVMPGFIANRAWPFCLKGVVWSIEC